MLQLDAHTSALDAVSVQQFSDALRFDPEFVRGFSSGMETYEEWVGDCGHMLSTSEVCRTIAHELNPRMISRNARYYQLSDIPESPMYVAGFLAGWVAMHTVRACSCPVVAKEPLPVVLPVTGQDSLAGLNGDPAFPGDPNLKAYSVPREAWSFVGPDGWPLDI